jgi:hypothetical protein
VRQARIKGSSLGSTARACLNRTRNGWLTAVEAAGEPCYVFRGDCFSVAVVTPSCEVLAVDGVLPPAPAVRAITEN